MTYTPLGMNSVDAQYIQQRNLSTSQILSIFNMPPHKIGILNDATKANIEIQALGYVTDTLMPWLERKEAAYEAELLTPREQEQGYFFEHNIMRLLRGDIKSRFAAYAQGRQWGWLSVDDIREMENMPLLGEENGGEEYLRPLNMIPVGEDNDALTDDDAGLTDADLDAQEGKALKLVQAAVKKAMENYQHA